MVKDKSTVPRSQYNRLADLVDSDIDMDAEKALTALETLLDSYFSMETGAENFADRLEYEYDWAHLMANIVFDYISDIRKRIREIDLCPIPEA